MIRAMRSPARQAASCSLSFRERVGVREGGKSKGRQSNKEQCLRLMGPFCLAFLTPALSRREREKGRCRS